MPTNFDQLLLFHFQEKRVDEFFELIQENLNVVNHYFKTVFRTFLKHKQYIKNALETDYSNAKLEATNKLIKSMPMVDCFQIYRITQLIKHCAG